MQNKKLSFKEKYIGDKQFYRTLLVLVLPIVIQQFITNFVSLLDNLMVGRLGTLPMSSVSIVNQLIFVFNLAVFGGLSGASIFGTQFFGVSDFKGMRDTFRFKMYFSIVTSALAIGLFIFCGEDLVLLFLENEKNTAEEIAATIDYAMKYLRVSLVGLLPFAIVQAYAGTLRECGQTVIPMVGGSIAIGVNLVFNYILIYGKFGFPALGVTGAAIATVFARFVELIFVVAVTHKKHTQFKFIEGAYRGFSVPLNLVKRIAITGTPLLVNEVLWSLGQTFINRNYSIRGITVIAATNITSTAWNLFCVIMFAMGSAVSIVVGQKLGAGDTEGAIDSDRKLVFFSIISHVLIAILLIISAPFIPMMYNVEPEVKELATKMLTAAAVLLPVNAFNHIAYFSIRSGGKTLVTFLLDAVYTWCVPALVSLLLCYFTSLDIIIIYACTQFCDVLKVLISYPLLHSGFWAKCVISDVSNK
ncbi:MAG: MATE family efflux transporter [Ruminococcaceae bacterium]|nr:MATE family efflux transporter [Oscillospiraceae bacterium]